MTEAENRLFKLEQYVYYTLGNQIRTLQDLVNALRNAQNQGGFGGGGGGSPAAFFVCMAPSSGTYAGTWSGSAPTAGASFGATVYQVSDNGTSQTITDLGTQTVVNWLPATLANSKACVLAADGAGGYGVVSQSCT
jgi:hypothetical protein